VVQILKAAGYEGSLTIEDESLSKFQGAERQRQLRRDVDHLKGVLTAGGGSRVEGG
jgi:hypothetical protein